MKTVLGDSRGDGQIELATVDGRLVMRQRVGGVEDLFVVAMFAIGVFGLARMLTSPVTAATWILGPFLVGFVALGLGTAFVRLAKRDMVTLDAHERTVSASRISLSYDPRPFVVVVSRMTTVGRSRRAQRVWDVQITDGSRDITILSHVGTRHAENMAAEVRCHIAAHIEATTST